MKKEAQINEMEMPTIENLAMAQVTPGESVLAELNEKFGDLDAENLDEKELADIIREIKKARTGLESTRKSVASILSQLGKRVNAKAYSIIEKIQELEKKFTDRKDEIERLKAEEAEKERFEAARLFNERTQILFDAGFTFNGVQYTAGTVYINAEEVTQLDELGFESVVESGRIQAEKIKAMLEDLENKSKKAATHYGFDGEEARPINGQIMESEGEPAEGEQIKPSDLPPVQYSKRPSMPEQMFDELHFYDPKKVDWMETIGVGMIGNAEELVVDPDSPAHYRPEGYRLGFEACRAAILNLLLNEPPMKRSELVEKIKNISF